MHELDVALSQRIINETSEFAFKMRTANLQKKRVEITTALRECKFFCVNQPKFKFHARVYDPRT